MLAAVRMDLVIVAAFLLLDEVRRRLEISVSAIREKFGQSARWVRNFFILIWLQLSSDNLMDIFIGKWSLLCKSSKTVHDVSGSKLIEQRETSLLVNVLWVEKCVGLPSFKTQRLSWCIMFSSRMPRLLLREEPQMVFQALKSPTTINGVLKDEITYYLFQEKIRLGWVEYRRIR